MAFHSIHEGYAVIDCTKCGGSGHIITIRTFCPPFKDPCDNCRGIGVVKIPVQDIETCRIE